MHSGYFVRRAMWVAALLACTLVPVLVGAEDAGDEYTVADFVADYREAEAGQTRDTVRRDGWLYGKTTPADMFAFEPLTYAKGHSCFGEAYGGGFCLFVQASHGGHLHPDADDVEAAVRYTFQQPFKSVNVNGTLRRVRPSGDGNTARLVFRQDVLFNYIVPPTRKVPFSFRLDNVRIGDKLIFSTGPRGNANADSMDFNMSVMAPCDQKCTEQWCAADYERSCNVGKEGL
jgi:hypothetical protein